MDKINRKSLNLLKKLNVYSFLFFTACTFSNNNPNQNSNRGNDSEPRDKIFQVQLEQEIGRIQPSGIKEIGNKITYIPLQTSPECLLSRIDKIVLIDSFLIVGEFKNISAFNLRGRFLNHFGRIGRGSGEYLGIRDFCYSSDKNYIYILTNEPLPRCLKFSIDGKYLNYFKLDSIPNPSQMLPIDKDFFVFHPINSPKHGNSTELSLVISDLNNNIKKTHRNYHVRYNEPGVTFSKSPLYNYQGNIRFKETGVDTLYTVTEKELVPYAVFSLGKNEIPADLHTPGLDLKRALAPHRGKFWLRWICEDPNCFYITLEDDQEYLYGFYNKQNDKAKIIGFEGFQNDIDGGLPFFPKYIYKDSILVDYVEAADLREHVQNSDANEMKKQYGKKYENLVKLANRLDDESNPVIVIVTK